MTEDVGMASAMRKMAVYLGLVEDGRYDDRYGDEYDEAYDEFGDAAVEPGERRERGDDRPVNIRTGQVESSAVPHGMSGASGAAEATASDRSSAGHQPITTDLARITTLHPRTYNEARTIGEHFREGIPVIMNLTEMSDSDAKRLVDFAAGLIFGLHGSIERVTNKVFLLSPVNVEVTAEDKARIAERNFFNQS